MNVFSLYFMQLTLQAGLYPNCSNRPRTPESSGMRQNQSYAVTQPPHPTHKQDASRC